MAAHAAPVAFFMSFADIETPAPKGPPLTDSSRDDIKSPSLPRPRNEGLLPA